MNFGLVSSLLTRVWLPFRMAARKVKTAFMNCWTMLRSANTGLGVRLVASSFAINTLMLAMPIMTLQVYDRIMTNKHSGTLAMLSIGIVIAVTAEMALRTARSYLFSFAASAFEYRRIRQVIRTVASARMLPALHKGTGEYVQTLTALSRIKDFAGERLVTLAMDLPYMLLFLVLTAYIGGMLVVVPAMLALGFGALAWYLGAHLQKAIQARNRSDEQRYGAMLEALSGIHTIKSMGLEPRFCRDFEQLQTQAGGINFRVALLNHMLATSGAAFAQAIIVGVVAGGAPMVLAGQITVGGLIACVLLSGRLIQPLQAALSLWISYQEYRQAENSVQQVCSMPKAVYRKIPAMARTVKEGRIICREMSFAYNEGDAYTLSAINLVVMPGETVALRGLPGAGRSTLLKIIAGMYEPARGTVRVDGFKPFEMAGEALIRHVAYLTPDAALFRGTIMENITGFHQEYESLAFDIAHYLGIDAMVARLPFGYETRLDGGPAETVAPGFRQRIAMARVLIHKPKIILFDRADRSLDREGYNHVFRLFARLAGKATILMATDDQNLLRLATRECTLARGTMFEAPLQDNVDYPLLLNYARGARFKMAPTEGPPA